MNGPGHYAEAERILAHVVSIDAQVATGAEAAQLADEISRGIAQAQVHATLAAAAAAAYPAIVAWCGEEASEPRDWARVTA